MKAKLIRPAVAAVAIVGALLVAGGIAYATIPDGGGVIHACYQKNQGTLRIIDTDKAQTCSSSESPLNWSQTGPQGQQGPQGIQGPQGPSDVYSVDGFGAGVKSLPLATWVNLATTPTLPTGSYFVQAEAMVENIQSLHTNFTCDLVDSSTNELQFERFTGSDWATIPVQAVITLSSPDTISLRCLSFDQGLSEAANWQLAAIKVGTVHS